jgi:hypothetical protein
MGYATDLRDSEWQILEPLLEPKQKGRPRKHALRDICNAIRYVQRTGCQWRMLPPDFPPWLVVYMTFWRWRNSGLLISSLSLFVNSLYASCVFMALYHPEKLPHLSARRHVPGAKPKLHLYTVFRDSVIILSKNIVPQFSFTLQRTENRPRVLSHPLTRITRRGFRFTKGKF